MAEKMSLQQVRDWAAKTPANNGWKAKERDEAVAAIDAHLAQSAQAVDVGALVEAIASEWDGCEYEGVGEHIDIGAAIRRKARAIGNAQAEGWKAGATLPIDVRGKWFEVPVPVHLHVIALRDRVEILDSAENLVAVYDAVSRSNLMRDVKTPETKARIVRNALSSAKPQPEE